MIWLTGYFFRAQAFTVFIYNGIFFKISSNNIIVGIITYLIACGNKFIIVVFCLGLFLGTPLSMVGGASTKAPQLTRCNLYPQSLSGIANRQPLKMQTIGDIEGLGTAKPVS